MRDSTIISKINLKILKGVSMMLNKFTAGMVLGGVAGAMGVKMMTTSKRGRRKMMKNGRRMLEKATDLLDELR